jgi:hypothetical protein
MCAAAEAFVFVQRAFGARAVARDVAESGTKSCLIATRKGAEQIARERGFAAQERVLGQDEAEAHG